MKENYHKILDSIIEENKGKRPKLLLHCCCAPCSSYCMEYLMEYFDITVYFYNPNISYELEYDKRVDELIRLIKEMFPDKEVETIIENHTPEDFYEVARGYENEPERGKRCERCFDLRLDNAARFARDNGFDYFTTTLSISPHKDAQLLNAIGKKKSEKYGVNYLYSDFKKKNGYKRSIELSNEYNLYRQDYCGCIYSKRERENKQ